MKRPKTIFCDIDGTLVEHASPVTAATSTHVMNVLEGTREKFSEWDQKGYNIILVTGRRESMRTITQKQLSSAGIIYDTLIMGIGGGQRILINDLKPNDNKETAIAINLKRNTGVKDVQI